MKSRRRSYGTRYCSVSRRISSSTGTPAPRIPTPRRPSRTLPHPREAHPRVRHPGRAGPVTPRGSLTGRPWSGRGTPLNPSRHKLQLVPLSRRRRGGGLQRHTHRNRSLQDRRSRDSSRRKNRRRSSKFAPRRVRTGRRKSHLRPTRVELLLDLGVLLLLASPQSRCEDLQPSLTGGVVEVGADGAPHVGGALNAPAPGTFRVGVILQGRHKQATAPTLARAHTLLFILRRHNQQKHKSLLVNPRKII